MDPKRNCAVSEPSAEDESDVIEGVLGFATLLGRRKRLLFGLPIVVGVLAAAYSMAIPFEYSARTSFLPPQQHQSVATAAIQQLGGLAGVAGSSALRRPEDMYLALLRSERLRAAMIDRFRLMTHYESDSRKHVLEKLTRNTRLGMEKGGLIVIEITDKEAQFSAELANGYIEELRKVLGTLSLTEAQQRRAFFEQQLTLAKERLVRSEILLKQTQERTGIIALDRQGESAIQAAASLRAQIASREVQIKSMDSFATARNPEVQRMAIEIESLKSQLAKLEQGQNTGRSFIPLGKVPEAGLDYVRALREVKYNEAIWELLFRQYELAKADEARDGPLLQQVDVATPPEMRSSPKRTRIVLWSTLAGGMLALFYIILISGWQRLRADPRYSPVLDSLRSAWTKKPLS